MFNLQLSRAVWLGLVVLAFFVGTTQRAHACSCNMPEASAALQASAAVFEGRVLSTRVVGDRLEATFRVTQAWKGIDTEEVVVGTISHESMCGVPFTEGSVWLVYAESAEGMFHTGLCHRTRLRAEADEDVQAFGAGVTPVDPEGPSPLDEEEAEEPVEPPGARGGCASCSASAPSEGAWMLFILVALRKRAAMPRRG